MIKGAGKRGDKPLLVVGLSAENCFRLQEGKPISFDAAELGLPTLEVLIVGGQTEEDIARQLNEAGLLRGTWERRQ